MNQLAIQIRIVKPLCILISSILFFLACSSDNTDSPSRFNAHKITFIGQDNDPDTEIVIKKMIRSSILDDEYVILSGNDTIELDAIGRSYFMIGERNRVLDSVVIDQGDIVRLSVEDRNTHIITEISDISANLNWLTDYQYKVEDEYAELLKPISHTPDNIKEISRPLPFTNDYEIMMYSYTHPYFIDRETYQKDKEAYDHKIKDKYLELEVAINDITSDQGSQAILRNALFTLTKDKLQRMGSSNKQWMFDKMNAENAENCGLNYTTAMSDYYANYLTGKHFQNINVLNLENAYNQAKNIKCSNFKQEILRTSLLKMYTSRSKPQYADQLLEEYSDNYKDTIFYNLIDDRFGVHRSPSNQIAGRNAFIDKNNKDYYLEEILQEHKGSVILLDIWASWCAPCRQNMPKVRELEEKYKDQNLKVIYASIDPHLNSWKRASKDEGIYNLSNYWFTDWDDAPIRSNLDIRNIPRYVIYDKTGEIAYQNALKPDAVEDILVDLFAR